MSKKMLWVYGILFFMFGQTWGQTLPVVGSTKFVQSLINKQVGVDVADQSKINQVALYQAQASEQNLANHPTWQRLFYVGQGQISEVTYQNFFLTPNGKADLSLELAGTIEQLFLDASQSSPQCRFPARTEWLLSQLNIDKSVLPIVDCTEFNDWFSKINPHTLTLVFASDYMGNPSSMFGHTLIRLDPPNSQKNMDLVAYALNYAAMTPPDENSAVYAFKGLTGGYGGEYSLMRYFHKTKEYGDLESRDMWEYQLDLTPSEVQFLVKHIWEMKGVSFPYYFMDKNCSYALMGLIDLVRPNLQLQSQFGWTVIPIETVKAIKKAGLIKNTQYRPALETTLKAQERHYGASFAKLADNLAKNANTDDLLKNYDPTTQAALLEMAYDNLYFSQSARTVDRAFAQRRLRELLLLRSQLNEPKQRIEPTRPTDPTEGHGAKLWGVAVGQTQNQDTVVLSYRTAYHGLLDPQDGYHAGQLLFLHGALRLKKDDVELERLDILSVKSVNPMTSYKRQQSWGVDIGYQQMAIDGVGKFSPNEQHGVAHLAMERGYSKALFDEKLLCGAYGRAIVQMGRALTNHVRAGFSPVLQCQWQGSNKWQALATFTAPYWTDNQWQQNMTGELQYNITPNNTLRLTGEYEQQKSQNWHKLMVGYQHYF